MPTSVALCGMSFLSCHYMSRLLLLLTPLLPIFPFFFLLTLLRKKGLQALWLCPQTSLLPLPKSKKALFFQEMAKSYILFGPSFFLNWDLCHHLKDVLYMAERICSKIKNGDVVLEGKLPSSPFPAKIRNL